MMGTANSLVFCKIKQQMRTFQRPMTLRATIFHRSRLAGGAMSLEFILVAGPLVRASSWEPTARHLRGAGYRVQVPDVLAYHHPPPSWSAWNSHLLEHINPCSKSVFVGHSSASALVADLAAKLPCLCLIIVDGELPPSQVRHRRRDQRCAISSGA
jgi:hypothetical protein